jgi:hypothetical protein
MVLQVRADIGVGERDRNIQRLEEGGGADAGDLQQLRRIDRAGGEDDFAASAGGLRLAVLLVFDADRARALE